jgi:hypothetical protein
MASLIRQTSQHLRQAIDTLFEFLTYHLTDEEIEVGL